MGSAHCQTDRGPCQLWSVDWNSLFFLFICPSCILPCAWKHDTVYAITLLSQKNITFLLFFLCFKEHHVLYLLAENTLVSQVFCYLFSPVFMIHSVGFQIVSFTSLSPALLLVKHTVISTGTFQFHFHFFPFLHLSKWIFISQVFKNYFCFFLTSQINFTKYSSEVLLCTYFHF